MHVIPWETTNRLNIRVTRWKTLPVPAFRQINAAYTQVNGVSEQLEETVYPLGGDIDIDKVYVRDQGVIVDPRQNQIDMFLAGLMYLFNNYLINGDTATDANGIIGLKVRAGNLPARQTISMGTNGLDVRASTANEHTFMDNLHQLMYVTGNGMGPGNGTCLFMNDNSYLNFTSVLRRLALFKTTEDSFGRDVPEFMGAKMYDMGFTSESQATRVITQTETQGNTTDNTSIYCVKFDDQPDDSGGIDVGEMLTGIEMYPMEVEDIGQLQSGPQFRTRIDWPIGLALWNNRAISRLKGIRWTT